MKTAEDFATALRAEPRSLRRKHLLQTASNHLPPGALTALYLQLESIGGKPLCTDAPHYQYMTAPARRRAAQNAQFVANHTDATHSEYFSPDTPKGNKPFYILLSGGDGQFYIPLAVVLHNLPAGPKDVLVLRSGLTAFYTRGVKGFGATPYMVAQSIKTRFETGQYKQVNVIGFSAGGVFALRLAEQLRAQTGLSFGGRFGPQSSRPRLDNSSAGLAYDVLCPCTQPCAGRLINVAGAKNGIDSNSMQRLRAARPRLIQHYLVNYGGHNVLLRMLRFGQLAPFLWLALAAPTWLLRTATLPFALYGGFVRGLRKLVGVQS